MKKLWLLCAGFAAWAVSGAPHIGFIMPSGARQGSRVELIIGGQKFYGADNVYVSGGGVTVEYVEAVRGMPHPDSTQRRYINKWLKNIHGGNPARPPLPESTEGWRHHPWFERLDSLSDGERDILYRFLFVRKNSLQASPAIANNVLVRLHIAPDAKPGEREFRVLCRGKVSNPLKFFISSVPEYREPYFPLPPHKAAVVNFNIPAVLNGQIMPGEKDDFTFFARKGETLTFSAMARYLMPFIGDGVPGHFQMVMEIFDAAGNSVAYADDRNFDPDPELVFSVPSDGKYTLQIRDALYRGREDFVYRVNVSRGVPPERKLPVPELPKLRALKGKDIAADKVLYPGVLISDVLSAPGKKRYCFRAEKGVPLMLEVYGRRQGSPIDPLLKIFDNSGRMVAVCDDVPRLKAGVILHGAADPALRFTAEKDGVYYAEVSDVTGKYGAEYGYYLRISNLMPHFRVYATPSAVKLNRNGWGKVELAVERFDGFDGEIKLRLRNAGNIRFDGAKSIPAGSSRCVVTLFCNEKEKRSRYTAEIEAYAENFTTRVIPGDEMMQAFAYTHIAPAQKLQLGSMRYVPGKERFSWDKTPSVLVLDRERSVTVNINTRHLPENAGAELVMVDPPAWLKVAEGDSHIVPQGKMKDSGNRKKMTPHQLTLRLYAEKSGDGKSVNQLFKVIFTYDAERPDANGKIRRYTQEVILPAIRITGKSK